MTIPPIDPNKISKISTLSAEQKRALQDGLVITDFEQYDQGLFFFDDTPAPAEIKAALQGEVKPAALLLGITDPQDRAVLKTKLGLSLALNAKIADDPKMKTAYPALKAKLTDKQSTADLIQVLAELASNKGLTDEQKTILRARLVFDDLFQHLDHLFFDPNAPASGAVKNALLNQPADAAKFLGVSQFGLTTKAALKKAIEEKLSHHPETLAIYRYLASRLDQAGSSADLQAVIAVINSPPTILPVVLPSEPPAAIKPTPANKVLDALKMYPDNIRAGLNAALASLKGASEPAAQSLARAITAYEQLYKKFLQVAKGLSLKDKRRLYERLADLTSAGRANA